MRETPSVSRRSFARGAAWSIPVVAASVAAPAASASPPCSATCADLPPGTVEASCPTLGAGNLRIQWNICAPRGKSIPAGSTIAFNDGIGGIGGWTFAGSLLQQSTSQVDGSRTTWTLTAPIPAGTCTTVVSTAKGVFASYPSVCVTRVGATSCNVCASKQVNATGVIYDCIL